LRTFLVERDLTGISMADLHGVAAAQQRHTALMRADGDRIYYLGSTFVPDEGRCQCLLEARDISVIAALNATANLPCTRIMQAVTLAMPPTATLG
jgi:hypothetical protein